MRLMDSGRHRYLFRRFAALWLVVLALGLAVIGMVIALQQSRSMTLRLMAPAEALADRFARQALDQFDRRLAAGLDVVETHVCTAVPRPWDPPPAFPAWLDGLFVWDGRELTVVSPPYDTREALRHRIEDRLSAEFVRSPESSERRDELLYDSIDTTPVVVAYRVSSDARGRRVLVAAHIDLQRLKADLVEPLLPTSSGLELVRSDAGGRQRLWSQRLFSALRFWAIRPTDAFVREQTRAVISQTSVYLGLTGLALATLLVAMWVLVRVVRRDTMLGQMKANFVADVSHELKTPLALIRMFAETLQSGRVPTDEKRQEYYGIIARESTRLTNLIDNILDFAQIDAGRREYTLEPTAIEDVVRDTYEAYRDQFDHNGFEHHLTIEPALPPVDADRDAITQVLINLINNAIKYSSEERYVALDVIRDTRRGRHGALISVHDRGIGIRAEDRGHLLEGFFRSSDGRVRGQGGTGLGLALVKHIVDAHGGSLDVESRLVKGSTFRIFLPASERHSDGQPGDGGNDDAAGAS